MKINETIGGRQITNKIKNGFLKITRIIPNGNSGFILVDDENQQYGVSVEDYEYIKSQLGNKIISSGTDSSDTSKNFMNNIKKGNPPFTESISKTNLKKLIKQIIRESTNSQSDTTFHTFKTNLYKQLSDLNFRPMGSAPRNYMEYYLNGFATVDCSVNYEHDGQHKVSVEKYYDNERFDKDNFGKSWPIPVEEQDREQFMKKIVQLCKKLQDNVRGDESIFGGIDENEKVPDMGRSYDEPSDPVEPGEAPHEYDIDATTQEGVENQIKSLQKIISAIQDRARRCTDINQLRRMEATCDEIETVIKKGWDSWGKLPN